MILPKHALIQIQTTSVCVSVCLRNHVTVKAQHGLKHEETGEPIQQHETSCLYYSLPRGPHGAIS